MKVSVEILILDHENKIFHGEHRHDNEGMVRGEKEEPGGNVITEEVEEIIKEERKLSRKFSGIADILERKMAGGSKQILEKFTFLLNNYYYIKLFYILEKEKRQVEEEEALRKEKAESTALLFNL